MELLIVVATDEEYKLAKKYFCDNNKIIKTGVGYGNVFNSLKDIDRETPIFNFGYAGSNFLDIGMVCNIGVSKNYHPNTDFEEKTYFLNNGDFTCYSSNDFVIKTEIKEPCLFDMELYAILSMGFKNVEAIKIVSDNLSLKQYNIEINKI